MLCKAHHHHRQRSGPSSGQGEGEREKERWQKGREDKEGCWGGRSKKRIESEEGEMEEGDRKEKG